MGRRSGNRTPGCGSSRLDGAPPQRLHSPYPEIGGLPGQVDEGHLLLDGGVVAFDDGGHPRFERLQSRMNLASDGAVRHRMLDVPVTYGIFDLLWLDGRPTPALPYRDRRKLFAGLHLDGPSWRAPAHREGDWAGARGVSRVDGSRHPAAPSFKGLVADADPRMEVRET